MTVLPVVLDNLMIERMHCTDSAQVVKQIKRPMHNRCCVMLHVNRISYLFLIHKLSV